jgi:DNA ligase-1
MKFAPVYKRTSTGAVQQWVMEVEGNKFRTISGQVDGKQTVSKWTECFGKNTGKSNATTDEEQALKEATARRVKQMEKHYYEDVSKIDQDKFVKAMLAAKYEDNAHRLPTVMFSQPKLDGIRCIVTKDGMVAGRSGKPIVSAPHIYEALKPFFDDYPDVVLDGELYASALRDDFEKVVSLAKKSKPTAENLAESAELLEYWIYDHVCPVNGPSFAERETFLRGAFVNGLDNHSCLVRVHTELVQDKEHMDELYAGYLAEGQEGQMLRNGDAPYYGKRTKDLLKRKEFDDDEFEILRIGEGQGNWAGYAKKVFFKTKDGIEFDTGIKGNQEYCKELLETADNHIGKQATVRFQGYTRTNKPRFGVMYVIHHTERW